MAGFECKPVSVEITYGLERICMFTQQKNVYDLNNEDIKYRDVFLQLNKSSQHIILTMQMLKFIRISEMLESEARSLVEKNIITSL